VISGIDKKPIHGEQSWLDAGKRRVAAWVLRALVVGAALGTGVALLLLVVTASAFWKTYVRRESTSIIFDPSKDAQWYDWIVYIDLSCASAVIVLLVLGSLAGNGWRLVFVLPWREGKDFFRYGYSGQLFSPRFGRSCLHLGLIGMLINFVFVAATLIADLRAVPASPPAAEAANQVPENRAGAEEAGKEAKSKVETVQKVLLLVCASFFGTLVGALAYAGIGPLEGLTHVALGRHQLRTSTQGPAEALNDLAGAAGRLSTRLDAAVDQAEDFSSVLASGATFLQGINGASQAVQSLATQFRSFNETMEKTAGETRSAAKKLEEVGSSLETGARQLDQSGKALAALPEAFRGPLNDFSQMMKLLDTQLTRTTQSQEALSTAAKGLTEPIGLLAHLVRGLFSLVDMGIRAPLKSLVESQTEHNKNVNDILSAFQGLADNLKTLGDRLEGAVKKGQDDQARLAAQLEAVKAAQEAANESLKQHEQKVQADQAEWQSILTGIEQSLADLKQQRRQEQDTARRAAQEEKRVKRRGWLRWLSLFGVRGNHIHTNPPAADDRRQ
jgi:hypothetical protein